jgi:hypothetical protein
MTGYDVDFIKWTEETAQAISEGRWNEIDRVALADEVESLGKRDRREAISRLEVLLQHLLNSEYQMERTTASWTETIDEQRRQLALLFEDSPSLRAQADALIAKAYPGARKKASMETGIPEVQFPLSCKWSTAEVLGR